MRRPTSILRPRCITIFLRPCLSGRRIAPQVPSPASLRHSPPPPRLRGPPVLGLLPVLSIACLLNSHRDVVQQLERTVAMSVTFHTTHGDIKVEIFCEAVPKTAENFLALCASGYYNNCLWHRNIKAFMVQTGDPTGSGKGGQSIWGKPFADELRSTLKFNNRGILAMANSGPDTNKSQFFITYAKQPHLDGKYTIFGKVIDGADSTLDAMERVPVNAKNRPLNEIRTIEVTVHANPIADAELAGR